VLEHDPCAAGIGHELDAHHADMAWVQLVLLPALRVDQAPRPVDLAVLAHDRVQVAVLITHPQHVASANLEVDVATGRGPAGVGGPPSVSTSGLVQASKTSSGGAANVRSRRSVAIAPALMVPPGRLSGASRRDSSRRRRTCAPTERAG
jgi:hypothetical protein